MKNIHLFIWSLLVASLPFQALAGFESGSADQVLRVPGAGGRPQFGQVDLSKTAATKNQLPISRGGTNGATKTAGFDNLSPNSILGDILYHDGTNNVRLPGNTTAGKYYLTQTGDGVNSAAPVWEPITSSNVTKTANYTLTNADGEVDANAIGGSFTLTLPSAAANPGLVYYILKSDTSYNSVTIATTGGDLLSGESSQVMLAPFTGLIVKSNGSSWNIF